MIQIYNKGKHVKPLIKLKSPDSSKVQHGFWMSKEKPINSSNIIKEPTIFTQTYYMLARNNLPSIVQDCYYTF